MDKWSEKFGNGFGIGVAATVLLLLLVFVVFNIGHSVGLNEHANRMNAIAAMEDVNHAER